MVAVVVVVVWVGEGAVALSGRMGRELDGGGRGRELQCSISSFPLDHWPRWSVTWRGL